MAVDLRAGGAAVTRLSRSVSLSSSFGYKRGALAAGNDIAAPRLCTLSEACRVAAVEFAAQGCVGFTFRNPPWVEGHSVDSPEHRRGYSKPLGRVHCYFKSAAASTRTCDDLAWHTFLVPLGDQRDSSTAAAVSLPEGVPGSTPTVASAVAEGVKVFAVPPGGVTVAAMPMSGAGGHTAAGRGRPPAGGAGQAPPNRQPLPPTQSTAGGNPYPTMGAPTAGASGQPLPPQPLQPQPVPQQGSAQAVAAGPAAAAACFTHPMGQAKPVKVKAPAERDYDFFINHCQASGQDQCGKLDLLLKARGCKVWYDMAATDLTAQGMEEGVANSRNVLIFLSKGIMGRPFCQMEQRWGKKYNCNFVGVVEQDTRHDPADFAEEKAAAPPDLKHLLDDVEFETYQRRQHLVDAMMIKIMSDGGIPPAAAGGTKAAGGAPPLATLPPVVVVGTQAAATQQAAAAAAAAGINPRPGGVGGVGGAGSGGTLPLSVVSQMAAHQLLHVCAFCRARPQAAGHPYCSKSWWAPASAPAAACLLLPHELAALISHCCCCCCCWGMVGAQSRPGWTARPPGRRGQYGSQSYPTAAAAAAAVAAPASASQMGAPPVGARHAVRLLPGEASAPGPPVLRQAVVRAEPFELAWGESEHLGAARPHSHTHTHAARPVQCTSSVLQRTGRGLLRAHHHMYHTPHIASTLGDCDVVLPPLWTIDVY
jgi:hypothetical protein